MRYPSRLPDSTPQVHDVSVSTAIARAVQHDSAALVPASPPPPSTLCTTTSVRTVPLYVDENIMKLSRLDNNIVPASLYSADQTASESENVLDSAASPDPATASVATDIETSA